MFADLVVHSKDLLTIAPKEILTTEPVYTIFNGQSNLREEMKKMENGIK